MIEIEKHPYQNEINNAIDENQKLHNKKSLNI